MSTLYAIIVSSADPLRSVRTMTDKGLLDVIGELRGLESPNEFQAKVFAWAMTEAVSRWRCSLIVSPPQAEKEGVQVLSGSGFRKEQKA